MPDATTTGQSDALIAAGSRVIIVVSSGPDPSPSAPRAMVPDVTGMKQGKALTAIQGQGLQARVINDYSDSYVAGKVMGQLPVAGSSRSSGSEVMLLVSSGASAQIKSRVALPDVVGMQEADAVAKLKSALLSPQVVSEPSATVPAGIVMQQLPDAAWLAANPAKKSNWLAWIGVAAVVLVLAILAVLLLGGNKVEVPNVVGMTLEEATTEIEGAGLMVGEVELQPSDEAPKDEVLAQSPEPGEEVREDSRVDLVVSAGAELVEVPDVVGLTQTEAIKALQAEGLVASPKTEPTDKEDPGTVIAQSPEAGIEVAPGEVIEITVAAEPTIETVEVPNVVGITETDAKASISDAGLKAQVVSSPSADVAKGVVISQLPQAGSIALPGASVAIVVSSGAPEQPATIRVPNVVGEELADAEETLEKLGLVVQATATSGTAENSGDVLAQVPEAGAMAAEGSTVVLLYAE